MFERVVVHWSHMFEPSNQASDTALGHTRIIPIHSPEPPKSPENGDAKTPTQDESSAHPSEPVRTGPELFEEVWLTVDEAVAYCAEQGLSRTAKTLRKWAERSFNVPEGEVVSLREDTLWGRYRWKIERASLVRKVAEELSRERDAQRDPVQTGAHNASAVRPDRASLASSHPAELVRTSLNGEPKPQAEISSLSKVAPAAPETEPVRTRSDEEPQKRALAEELATLRAENTSLREQQKHDRDEIGFLREEITSNRSLKTDLAHNSNRLLETLETLAIGGRLDRQTQRRKPMTAVRYEQPPYEADGV